MKHKILFLSAVVLLGLTAAGQQSLAEPEEQKNAAVGLSDKETFVFRMGIIEGITALNNYLLLEGKPKIICRPKGHQFTEEEIKKVFHYTDPLNEKVDANIFGLTAIHTLQKMYPCN